MDCKIEETLRKGPWLEAEDERLVKFVTLLGERRWDSLAIVSGLKRSGKSCRLRWMNYLNPNLKHGPINQEEESIILQLHALWGNKWSKIARSIPGRTDNEIKNYWRTRFRKKEDSQNYELLLKHRETEVIRTRTMTQEHGLDKNVKDYTQRSMESGEEPNGGISEREEFGVMNSPFENRISDWISEISTDLSEAKVLEDQSSSCSENNINIGSWWFQETKDFEEFSCSLWS